MDAVGRRLWSVFNRRGKTRARINGEKSVRESKVGVSCGLSSARIPVVRGRCVTARVGSPRSGGSRTGARDESGKRRGR